MRLTASEYPFGQQIVVSISLTKSGRPRRASLFASLAGLSVSRLIWNRFQTDMPGHLARVLDLNPGITDSGVFLPIGMVVRMPVDIKDETERDIQSVNLWD